MKFEVGKIYKGAVNNCIIKVIEFKPDGTMDYIDLKNNKKGNAPIVRMEHSNFKEMKECC